LASERPIEILLVEDNPGDILLTLETFKVAKIRNQVHVVSNGREAMDYLCKMMATMTLPDLILLDLNLPEIDGRKLLVMIKADDVLSRIPVIVLTASSSDEDVLISYNLKADGYVTKPFDMGQVLKVVACIEEFGISITKLATAKA
jgi:two-component system, chemotaxis family, response regulator Rcp1